MCEVLVVMRVVIGLSTFMREMRTPASPEVDEAHDLRMTRWWSHCRSGQARLEAGTCKIPSAGTSINKEQFESLSERGIGNDDTIVLYGGNTVVPAAACGVRYFSFTR